MVYVGQVSLKVLRIVLKREFYCSYKKNLAKLEFVFWLSCVHWRGEEVVVNLEGLPSIS